MPYPTLTECLIWTALLILVGIATVYVSEVTWDEPA